jgi:DNA invertase Pin-like site-specific DNA recombinase
MSMQSDATVRAAIYARVSTDEQAEHGTSLEDQVRRCEAYCVAQGWTVAAIHREEGVSGSLASRPQLDQLMRSAKRGELDAIVVAKLDRWGRSMRHLSSALGDLDDLHVRFASVAEAIDSSTASGRLLRNVLGAIAEFEREAIIERTSSGLRAVARGGGWPGGPPPYGYRVERDGNRSRLAVDDGEAAIIGLAVDCLVDRRMTTWQTAAELNALGCVPRRAPRWTHHNLRRLLLDGRGLSGRWPYRRLGANDGSAGEIIVEIPAILTAERHLLLHAALARTSTGPGATARKTSYLLAGRLRSACGGTMHGISRRDRSTRVYRCINDRAEAHDRCTCRRAEASALEAAVWNEVVAVLRDPDRLFSLAQHAMEARRDIDATEHDDLGAIDRRIRRLEKGLGSTVADLARRGMDVAVVEAATAELESDLARLRQHRATVQGWELVARDKADRMQRLWTLARRAEEVLEDPTPDVQRRVLELLDVEVRTTTWLECEPCKGKGFVSAGVAPGMRRRGATGVACPACNRYRFIPVIEIRGVVPDATSLDLPVEQAGAQNYPFHVIAAG